MAARRVNRPVKLVLQRPQMFGPVVCRTGDQADYFSRGLERRADHCAENDTTMPHVHDGRIHGTGHDLNTDAVFDTE